MMQIREILGQTAAQAARLDREMLLAHVLGASRSHLYAHSEQRVAAPLHRRFQQLLAQRREGRPLAQLIGYREFWSLSLQVSADTFIPRPETEHLVQLALQLLPEGQRRPQVLDLGTGSGAIAIAIASERPDCAITATDRCANALAVARRNAWRLSAQHIRFRQGSWFAALDRRERYQMILSNPPYVAASDVGRPPLCFEPRAALVAGEDGLRELARIIHQAPEHLAAGGSLLVEHGAEQGRAVRRLFRERGYQTPRTLRDLQGLQRLSYAAAP